jgi:hypothetical protein
MKGSRSGGRVVNGSNVTTQAGGRQADYSNSEGRHGSGERQAGRGGRQGQAGRGGRPGTSRLAG